MKWVAVMEQVARDRGVDPERSEAINEMQDEDHIGEGIILVKKGFANRMDAEDFASQIDGVPKVYESDVIPGDLLWAVFKRE